MRVFHFGLSAHSKTLWDVAVEFSVAILRFVKCQHMKNWKRGTWVGKRYLSRVKILLHKIHRVQWVETRNESTESSPVFPPVFSGTIHVSLRRAATLHSLISWVPFLLLVFYLLTITSALSALFLYSPAIPRDGWEEHRLRGWQHWTGIPTLLPRHCVFWFWGEFTLLSKHVSSSLNGIRHVYLSGLLWGLNELVQATCMVLNEINISLN